MRGNALASVGGGDEKTGYSQWRGQWVRVAEQPGTRVDGDEGLGMSLCVWGDDCHGSGDALGNDAADDLLAVRVCCCREKKEICLGALEDRRCQWRRCECQVDRAEQVDELGCRQCRDRERKRERTFVPSLPLTHAEKQMMRPMVPSLSLTAVATSSAPALSASRSSSLPHSMPLCTRPQWARCRASSSGAPRVYERPQCAHVLRTELSSAKWSWVRVCRVRGAGLRFETRFRGGPRSFGQVRVMGGRHASCACGGGAVTWSAPRMSHMGSITWSASHMDVTLAVGCQFRHSEPVARLIAGCLSFSSPHHGTR